VTLKQKCNIPVFIVRICSRRHPCSGRPVGQKVTQEVTQIDRDHEATSAGRVGSTADQRSAANPEIGARRHRRARRQRPSQDRDFDRRQEPDHSEGNVARVHF